MENLIQDLHKSDYGYEGTMEFPLFQTAISVMLDRKKDLAYAQKCADYLCNMPQDTLLRLCTYMIQYCEEFREYLDPDDPVEASIPENISGMEILQFVNPSVLIVEKPDDPSVIGFHMECNCDWEPEHGLEFTIKDDKILYVGAFDDMPAWNKERLDYVEFYDPSANVIMNYADKED